MEIGPEHNTRAACTLIAVGLRACSTLLTAAAVTVLARTAYVAAASVTRGLEAHSTIDARLACR